MVWPYNQNGTAVEHQRAHENEDRAYAKMDQAPMSAWEERRRTMANMCDFGGSFVSQLGHAAQFADAENYEKLRAAFPDYFAKYAAGNGNGAY